MTRVILIRHGRTGWNRSRRMQGGENDAVLDQEGERKARSLADRLKAEKIKAVYSSPLSRAMGTAGRIAEGRRLAVIEDPAFREMDCGTLSGADIQDVGFRLQRIIAGGNEKELLFAGHGGESCDELQKRAWTAILKKVEKHRDETIAVVSHYFVLASILSAAVGIPASQLGRFRMGAASVSMIDFDSDGPFLSLFNDRCHLSGERI